MDGPYLLSVPLDARPRLLMGGVATHGDRAREFYRLPKAWCLHAYRYDADLLLDHHDLSIRPASVSVFPANVDIEVHFRTYPSTHVYVHFGLAPGGPKACLPPMQDLGLRFDSFYAELEKVVSLLTSNRLRAEVKLWNLLWELADRHANRSPEARHPAVTDALHAIELGLASDMRISRLSELVGLSHNHLLRLFKKELGMSISTYIRQRRLERARYLLEGSNRSIKSIAAEVGIPDLQHFNKLIRGGYGASPRQLRAL